MQINLQNISVFLSSPGDVLQERQFALKVINKLNASPLLNKKINLEVVAWDKPYNTTPLLASTTPQESINQFMKTPAECDIVVVILWSRLGTPLSTNSFSKSNAGQYLSGTEWEFLNAQERAKQDGKPRILLYRRTEEIQIDPQDPGYLEKNTQRERVNDFFKSLMNPDGSIEYGFTPYKTPSEFEDLLEQNLISLIAHVLDEKHISPISDEIKRSTNSPKRFKIEITTSGAYNRTVFILPTMETIFGMAKRQKNPDIDVVLRLIPSRSAKLDPENWEKSARISKVHWRLRVLDGRMQLMDTSRNGVLLDKFQLENEIDSLGDFAEIFGTDNGHAGEGSNLIRIRKNIWINLPDKIQLNLGEDILGLMLKVFRDTQSSDIESISISRVTNHPQHLYLQLTQRIKIGTTPDCALQLDLREINGVVGELTVKGGDIHITSFVQNELRINDRVLLPGNPVVLMEKDVVAIGNARLEFGVAQDEHFLADA